MAINSVNDVDISPSQFDVDVSFTSSSTTNAFKYRVKLTVGSHTFYSSQSSASTSSRTLSFTVYATDLTPSSTYSCVATIQYCDTSVSSSFSDSSQTRSFSHTTPSASITASVGSITETSATIQNIGFKTSCYNGNTYYSAKIFYRKASESNAQIKWSGPKHIYNTGSSYDYFSSVNLSGLSSGTKYIYSVDVLYGTSSSNASSNTTNTNATRYSGNFTTEQEEVNEDPSGYWSSGPTVTVDGITLNYSATWKATSSAPNKWWIVVYYKKTTESSFTFESQSIGKILSNGSTISTSGSISGLESDTSYTVRFYIGYDSNGDNSFVINSETIDYEDIIKTTGQGVVTPEGDWRTNNSITTATVENGRIKYRGMFHQTTSTSLTWTIKTYIQKSGGTKTTVSSTTATLYSSNTDYQFEQNNGYVYYPSSSSLSSGTYSFIFQATCDSVVKTYTVNNLVISTTGVITATAQGGDRTASITWTWTPDSAYRTNDYYYRISITVYEDYPNNTWGGVYDYPSYDSGIQGGSTPVTQTVSDFWGVMESLYEYTYKIQVYAKYNSVPSASNPYTASDLIATYVGTFETTQVIPKRPTLSNWSWDDNFPQRKYAWYAVATNQSSFIHGSVTYNLPYSTPRDTRNFMSVVWEDLLHWICDILDALVGKPNGATDSGRYYNGHGDSRVDAAHIQSSNKILYATKWNNFMQIYNEIVQKTGASSIASRYTFPSSVSPGDQVKGSYFTSLVDQMNDIVNGFNNETLWSNWPEGR